MTWVQDFSEGKAEQLDLLGGKGANIAEMTRLGIPVPPGFTVTTEACLAYLEAGGTEPDGLDAEVSAAIERLEGAVGRRFGDPDDPLLVSVRSGARFSMPGMMDTVLDVGLNPTTVKGLEVASGNAHFAVDSWRRFTEMFADVVLEVADSALSGVRRRHLDAAGVVDAAELTADQSAALVADLRALVEQRTGEPFPDDPRDQLHRCIAAVFRSWNGHRARAYRELTGISHDLGTAVNVQAMVFGNAGEHDSGTGVVFTRDPATGEPEPYGDWLDNAQGEDVVAGTRATKPFGELADFHPEAYAELVEVLDRLEDRYRDMCDVEFTVERGRLWVLQTRVGKRSARAAVRMAVDMANEGMITRREALTRVKPEQLERLLHPRFDQDADYDVLVSGLAASPGAASGVVCMTWQEAVARTEAGDDVILVREETSPEDIEGMVAARGILTSRGGLVSHAAVVARGIGRPAVCGAGDLEVDLDARELRVGDVVVAAGEVISLDGTVGDVVRGTVPLIEPEATPELEQLLDWADQFRRLHVWANADTPEDARRARANGAEGIGLCRTEHMFLGDRLPLIRDVILAEDEAAREEALAKLHDQQREDFLGLLVEMDGLPVTVRLLDPPLHEFLPDVEELRIAEATGAASPEDLELLAAAEKHSEHNPMLGTRGVRLGVLLPELYRAQVRALTEATMQRLAADGDPRPQVMIPLTVTMAEFSHVAEDVRATIARTAAGVPLHIPVGTMIETPRAALVADELVTDAEFCSFGTNDLTQLTFGFSRDDIGAHLLPVYVRDGLLDHDPFAQLDQAGVGRLVAEAVQAGARIAPQVHFGVCGEHGGDPTSIAYFHRIGLEYVSCSPFRVPIARLAAARTAIGAEV